MQAESIRYSGAVRSLIQAVRWVGDQQLMPKPDLADLRQRAIALVAGGETRSAVARLLRTGKSTVILSANEYVAERKNASKPMGGVRRAIAFIPAMPSRTLACPNQVPMQAAGNFSRLLSRTGCLLSGRLLSQALPTPTVKEGLSRQVRKS